MFYKAKFLVNISEFYGTTFLELLQLKKYHKIWLGNRELKFTLV